jgi:hypothetical protein
MSFGQLPVYATPTYYTSVIVDPLVRHDGVDPLSGCHVVFDGGSQPEFDIRVRYAASYLYVEGMAFVKTAETISSANEGIVSCNGAGAIYEPTTAFGLGVVLDKCLWSETLATSIRICPGLGILLGAKNASDKFVSVSNSVFHSFRNNSAVYAFDLSNFDQAWSIYFDNCTFGFNGRTDTNDGAGIWIDQENALSNTNLYLYNCNFGDNVKQNTPYFDLLYDRSFPGTLDGTHNLYGSNNVWQNGTNSSVSPGTLNNYLTNTITALDGFETTTTSTTSVIVNDVTTYGQYDLDLVQPTGGGNNLALNAGVNRIGSEPDPRQDFRFDILGRRRFAQAYDTGAFQVTTGVPFKYWNGTQWVYGSALRYWDGSAWQFVSSAKYWNGSQWAFPS